MSMPSSGSSTWRSASKTSSLVGMSESSVAARRELTVRLGRGGAGQDECRLDDRLQATLLRAAHRDHAPAVLARGETERVGEHELSLLGSRPIDLPAIAIEPEEIRDRSRLGD